MKKYTIAMTCTGGTGIAGDYLAESEAEAIKQATAEHGDEWTYYVFKEKATNAKKDVYNCRNLL